jgi:hypothetical protein
MKKTIFAMMAVAALMLGMTGCSKSDNPSPVIPEPTPNVISEDDLIGFWWDQFEYADVTEDGKAFTRVLLAVYVGSDHTGWIALGAYDDTSDDVVAVYGGPGEAGFTWRLLPGGKIQLGDPETGETYALTRGDGGAFGKSMTDASNTSMSVNNNGIAVSNANYSGTLVKADAEKAASIEQTFRARIQSNVDLVSGGKTPSGFSEDDIR